MKPSKIKEIVHYYLLALALLGGYFLAELIGIVPWAFNLNIIIMLIILTLYYGTVIMMFDKILHGVLMLK